MKLRGDDMLLFQLVAGDWVAIACSTHCELDVTADMMEVRHPLRGDYKQHKPRRMSWGVKSAHVLAMDEAAWLTAAEDEATLRVIVSVRENGHVRKPIVIQGDVMVTRVQSAGHNGQAATWSIETQGTGRPLFADLEWILADGVWNMQGEIWKDFGIWCGGELVS